MRFAPLAVKPIDFIVYVAFEIILLPFDVIIGPSHYVCLVGWLDVIDKIFDKLIKVHVVEP
jgi:hypothetical protein